MRLSRTATDTASSFEWRPSGGGSSPTNAQHGIEAGAHELGVVHDPGEEVVEVVGDAARELPHALEPLGLVELGLEVGPRLFDLGVAQPGLERGLVGLGALAVRDVADRGGDQRALVRLDRRERDVDRELGAVAAACGELQARAHRTRDRVSHVAGPVRRVGPPVALGDQQLDRLTEELLARVVEQHLGLTVDQADEALLVDRDDGVGGGVEQPLVAGLGAPALGEVPDRGRDQQALVRTHRREPDLGGELGAVLAPAGELTPRAHGPVQRSTQVALALLGMAGEGRLGHQDLHRLAQQLGAVVAEEGLGLAVGEQDASVLVGEDHGLGGGVEQLAHVGSHPSNGLRHG